MLLLFLIHALLCKFETSSVLEALECLTDVAAASIAVVETACGIKRDGKRCRWLQGWEELC